MLPIFGFVGLINNVLILLTLRNKNKKKLFTDQMYTYIQINSLFNIFYCLVIITSLVNICINNHSYSLYCSSVYTKIGAQYFKIIVQHFLGYVLRTCINVSYLFFSFSRFILVSNLKKKLIFRKFLNLNMKKYVVLLRN